LAYEATLWSIVFPLGMYAVAGIYLGRADSLPIVEAVGRGWLLAVALPVWTIVFLAMVVNAVRTVLQPRGVLTVTLPPRPSGPT
jgi:tellurite resistance protein TehA-like permease